ncbi:hypothetical protein VNO77_17355 [Canavalia gladiata]|uniref:Uncharacterized protein n=1 Tax=Canavalia gladiata TaxID=3824 RepID=A0AAN9LIT7_CANGL
MDNSYFKNAGRCRKWKGSVGAPFIQSLSFRAVNLFNSSDKKSSLNSSLYALVWIDRVRIELQCVRFHEIYFQQVDEIMFRQGQQAKHLGKSIACGGCTGSAPVPGPPSYFILLLFKFKASHMFNGIVSTSVVFLFWGVFTKGLTPFFFSIIRVEKGVNHAAKPKKCGKLCYGRLTSTVNLLNGEKFIPGAKCGLGLRSN